MIWKKTATHTPLETEEIGQALAAAMTEDKGLPPFVALYGDLGVGKTAFVRGFVSVISPNAAVRSPTFALVNEYRGGKIPVFHFDMYRIEGEDDLYSIGFYDYLDRGICLVEWSENIPFALPDDYFRVLIEKTPEDENERSITIERMEGSC
ncbi:MAG: tRNA (adenosine(37)-N6)-threonylcarbamoyltransferase complex ATPase subunit type 1 TsaE [Ruminococcaceae bacterium]|nr:tRNA (adenosine(37)-N6)-threonylcarbamoyltransferase complex ATPase subunit type 1 TsaE [Oscillospiraceae bacterium]